MGVMALVILVLFVLLCRKSRERKQQKDTSLYEDASAKSDEAELKQFATPPPMEAGPHDGEPNPGRGASSDDRNTVSIPVDVLSRILLENLVKEGRLHTTAESRDPTYSDPNAHFHSDRRLAYPGLGPHSHRQPCAHCNRGDGISQLLAALEGLQAEGRKHHHGGSPHHRASPYTTLNKRPVPNDVRSHATRTDIHPDPSHADAHHSQPLSNHIGSRATPTHTHPDPGYPDPGHTHPISNHVQSHATRADIHPDPHHQDQLKSGHDPPLAPRYNSPLPNQPPSEDVSTSDCGQCGIKDYE